MFCKWCGSQLVSNASFCTQCGGKVKPTPLALPPDAKRTSTQLRAFFLRNEQRDDAGALESWNLDPLPIVEEKLDRVTQKLAEEIKQSIWINVRGYIPGDKLVLVNSSEPEVFNGEIPTGDILNEMYSLYGGCGITGQNDNAILNEAGEHETRGFEGLPMSIGDLVALMPLKQNNISSDHFPNSATNGWACFDSETRFFQKTDFGFVRAEIDDTTVIWSDGDMNCTLAGAQHASNLLALADRFPSV
jgi:hypothetical protein